MLAPQGFSPPQPSEMTNLAFQTPVTASSSDPLQGGSLIQFFGLFSVAVDGSTSGVLNAATNAAQATVGSGFNLCTQTTLGANQAANGLPVGTVDPWLRVDLGTAGQPFDGVQFFSRTDCAAAYPSLVAGAIDCYTRNAGFGIAYGDDGSAFNSPNNYRPGTAGYACGTLPTDLTGGVAFVPCPGAAGRYVWVYLPGANRVLAVCELQVLQTAPWTWRTLSAGAAATIEIAGGKHAVQSSVLVSGEGGRGVCILLRM